MNEDFRRPTIDELADLVAGRAHWLALEDIPQGAVIGVKDLPDGKLGAGVLRPPYPKFYGGESGGAMTSHLRPEKP